MSIELYIRSLQMGIERRYNAELRLFGLVTAYLRTEWGRQGHNRDVNGHGY